MSDPPFPVTLNVYDVTNAESEQQNNLVERFNNFTHQLGIGGVFHGGLVVDGIEWSFGFCESGTGLYQCTPGKVSIHAHSSFSSAHSCCLQNPMYKFRQAIDLGVTPHSRSQVTSDFACWLAHS